jgi:lipid-A-disaccharide synthase
MRKIYMIAGEPSGDFIGSCILRKLYREDVEIAGIGGNLMQAEGLVSDLDINEIAVNGLLEVIPHILKIKKFIKKSAMNIANKKPDILLTIDSPGFCFRVARIVRKRAPGIRLIHLVAPSVWAWRPGRSEALANLYDKLLVLFDFETPYFKGHGLDTEFVGHPLAEECKSGHPCKDDVVVLMPGSRVTEVKRILPIFVEVFRTFRWGRVVIPTLGNLEPLVRNLTRGTGIEIISDELKKAEVYKKARLAIVASGTATLQLSLFGCPMIVCYKLNYLTYLILKKFVKVQYISLVNIILGKKIVPELIQNKCNASEIRKELININSDFQQENFKLIHEKIVNDDTSPSKRIVDILLS